MSATHHRHKVVAGDARDEAEAGARAHRRVPDGLVLLLALLLLRELLQQHGRQVRRHRLDEVVVLLRGRKRDTRGCVRAHVLSDSQQLAAADSSMAWQHLPCVHNPCLFKCKVCVSAPLTSSASSPSSISSSS